MKRLITVLVTLALVFGCVSTAAAADGNVIYDGLTQEFIFQPGSDYSLTDLFPNFKDVMPGDSLTQTITVRNGQSNQVKVEIYIRSLGAHADSEEFLSQMKLRVEKSEDNEMGYMFDAYAHESAQLTDWVCLGMLYSGGEVNLDVILDVPVEMGNEFQEQVGYLDWEFMVIEYPVEDTDPQPPKTGDETPIGLIVGVMVIAAAGLVIILLLGKRKKKDDAENN